MKKSSKTLMLSMVLLIGVGSLGLATNASAYGRGCVVKHRYCSNNGYRSYCRWYTVPCNTWQRHRRLW